jgi:hypothetical protein
MRSAVSIILVCCCYHLNAQELFTYTEPASNMATKSIGLRLNNTFMKERSSAEYNYHLIPEVMWGVSRKVMIHADAFLSNRDHRFAAEGGSVYLKHRFYSQDEVHSHFRMAAYTRLAFNNSDIHQPAIDLYGHNSGYEVGVIATKLINKVAISAGSAFLHATDNGRANKFMYDNKSRNAISYNLSLGKLVLPKEYISYDQVNLNIMLEMLGQTNPAIRKSFIDLAPSLQLIIQSKIRIDLGYRFAILDDLERTASDGYLLRLEYNIFNAYK